MKPHLVLFAATLIAGSAQVLAQDAATPVAPASSGPGTLMETGTSQPLLQTPELLPPPSATPPEATPAPGAPAALKKGSADQLRQAIRIRELKTQALEDPTVQAQKANADCAKTEEGRRVLMRNYYTLLYTKIEQLDPSLRPILEPDLHNILAGYEQHNVCPSVLIEPVVALPGSSAADHGAAIESTSAKPKKAKKKTL